MTDSNAPRTPDFTPRPRAWSRQKPPRLPDRRGLHPVRVGKRVNVKEARALDGSLSEWMLANIPRMSAESIHLAFDRGDVVDAWGGALTAEVPARVLEWPVYMYWSAADDTDDLPHIPVVFQGDGWLVVDKPKGLVTMPRGSYVARSVTVALRRQLGNADISPAHRLDRATGGLLLFTERPELRRPYQLLFSERRVSKTYRAVAAQLPASQAASDLGGVSVTVDPPEKPGWVKVESRIEKVERVMVSRIVPGEVNAITYLRATEQRVTVAGRDCVVYEVAPYTGKTHQIRLHFAALGAPLVGDPLYGGFNAARYGEDEVPPGASALHLDAVGLDFVDPQSGADVSLRLP